VDLIDALKGISSRISKMTSEGLIKTEEGTKTALILPFIQALGYNVFDPTEVTPELTADVGTKKGEKVDYAILRDGKPIMLMECKSAGTNLRTEHASQLFRYYTVTSTRFGILTDGVVYQFYTDLVQKNMMDSEPFFIFDMLDIRESAVEELKKFAKATFDEASIVSSATILKRRGLIKTYLSQQLQKPDEDFIRTCAQKSKAHEGRFTQTILDEFSPVIREALRQLINEQIEARLKSALEREATAENPVAVTETPLEAPKVDVPTVVTTQEETEGYFILKSILRDMVDTKRIMMRDAQSYCAVLLDDNNRRPICRFYFGKAVKSIIIFDEHKHENRVTIESLDDIYKHADALRAVVKSYLDKYE